MLKKLLEERNMTRKRIWKILEELAFDICDEEDE